MATLASCPEPRAISAAFAADYQAIVPNLVQLARPCIDCTARSTSRSARSAFVLPRHFPPVLLASVA